MKQTTTQNAKRNRFFGAKNWLVVMVVMTSVACQKEMVTPAANHNTLVAAPVSTPVTFTKFTVAETSIILLQGNEQTKALTLRWEPGTGAAGAIYTIEAALNGTGFEDFVELGSTDQAGIDITVKNLNRQMLQLIPAGESRMINVRVRANKSTAAPVYTSANAIQVSTYQNYTEYGNTQTMHIPGCYNNWDVTTAPQIVDAANEGIYEGVLHFTTAFTQFLMVKADSWNASKTYYNIGAGKFGFGGNIFNFNTGAGVYFLRANTNTNTWICSKISTMGISGTAVTTTGNDPVMSYNASTGTWSMNVDLAKGDFKFRANNTDAISFGKTVVNGFTVPDSKGGSFKIEKAGNYLVTLNLNLAGNYTCTLVRNSSN